MLSRKLRTYLARAGVDRADLFVTDATRKAITFYDATSATGITWAAARGDESLRIMQRAGHSSFETTLGYVREAENLTAGFGALPAPTGGSARHREGFGFRPRQRHGAAKKKHFGVGATGFECGCYVRAFGRRSS